MSQELSEPAFVCVFALAQACQIAIGQYLGTADALDLEALVSLFSTVPSPGSYAEAIVAAAIMMRFTQRLGQELARRDHAPGGAATHVASSAVPLISATVDGHAPPTWTASRAISTWYATHQSTAEGTIPLVTRVTRRIESTIAEPTCIREMAREFGCSVSFLQRRFTSTAGESINQYRTRVRVKAAIDCLRRTDWKVEAVAREVGWRSKKDLYKAFSEYLGVTPAMVRSMPAADADGLPLRTSRSLR